MLLARERVDWVFHINLWDATSAANVVVNSEIFWFVASDQQVTLFGESVCGEVVLDESTAFLHVTTVHETNCCDIRPGDIDAVTEVPIIWFGLDPRGCWWDWSVKVCSLQTAIISGARRIRLRHFCVYRQ